MRRLVRRGWIGVAVALASVALDPRMARAQSVMPGLDGLAEAIVTMTTRRWTGPRVSMPEERPRPIGTHLAGRSLLRPVAVHARGARGEARADEALAALELAHDVLSAHGWEPPLGDGGLGGTAGFDLYLDHAPRDAEAHPDGRVPWSFLDATTAFGVVGEDVPEDRLAACVTQAYALALLLALDPAEAPAWRESTAAVLTHLVTGRFGCEDDVAAQQAEPQRGWITRDAPEGGGALFVWLLSSRFDGGDARWLRDLWDLARQRTWEGLDLRASPDLWEATDLVLRLSGEQLDDQLAQAALDRWFLGDPARERGLARAELRGLGSDATTPPFVTIGAEDLPEHTPAADPPLEPSGSGYAVVDVAGAPPDSVLRVWLRGEYGVSWSLAVAKVGEDGRDLGRMTAPPMDIQRTAYLPVELGTDTRSVVLAVTNLSSRVPDADDPDENVRSFRLIVDLVPSAP